MSAAHGVAFQGGIGCSPARWPSPKAMAASHCALSPPEEGTNVHVALGIRGFGRSICACFLSDVFHGRGGRFPVCSDCSPAGNYIPGGKSSGTPNPGHAAHFALCKPSACRVKLSLAVPESPRPRSCLSPPLIILCRRGHAH